MKGCIVVNAYSKSKSELNQAYRLEEEFIKLNINVKRMRTDEICVYINGQNLALDLNFDFYVYLDKDKHVLEALKNNGAKIFNSPQAIEICDDKLWTHIVLAKNKIPMPKTIGGVLCYCPNMAYSKNLLEKVECELGYPVVVKECYGSCGKGVYLARNASELEKIAEQVKLKPHLFQQYIKSSFGKDIRVIVIGGKVIGCMTRQNDNDFRSNIELGGVGNACELKKEYKEISEKVAKCLGLDYCGIDLLIGNDGMPVVCEVNSNAFFGGFETVTGVNVAKLYAEYIIKKLI